MVQGFMNVFEPSIILRPEMVRLANTARVDSFCKIEGGLGVNIGEFVHIASYCHLNVGGGKLVIEDHATLSSSCLVGTGTPDWSYLYVSAAEPPQHHHTLRFLTRICSYAVLFMGAIVVPGVTVGEGAIVKPGSVVTQDVAPWCIVEGNPARVVGTRKVDTKPELSEGIYPRGIKRQSNLLVSTR